MRREIKGYELYEVCESGRVFSKKRNRFLTPYPNSSGYLRVVLSKDGVTSKFFLHQLVYSAFGKEPYEVASGDRFNQIDHIDQNKTNNHIDNLQLISARENSLKNLKDVKGYVKDGSRFRVRASIHGKRIELGRFSTEKEAKEVYRQFLKNEGIL